MINNLPSNTFNSAISLKAKTNLDRNKPIKHINNSINTSLTKAENITELPNKKLKLVHQSEKSECDSQLIDDNEDKYLPRLPAEIWLKISDFIHVNEYGKFLELNKDFYNLCQRKFSNKKKIFLDECIEVLKNSLSINADEKTVAKLKKLKNEKFLKSDETNYIYKFFSCLTEELNLVLFKRFFNKKFDKNKLDKKEKYFNDLKLIIKLISGKADYNLGTNSPLHQILTLEDDELSIEVAQLLLKNKFNINAQNAQGLTVLVQAIFYHKVKLFQFFLENGAELDIGDKYGNRAIHHLVKELYTYPEYMVMYEMLLEKNAKLDAQDTDGRTMLHIIADKSDYKHHNIDILSLLNKIHDKDKSLIHIANKMGETPIFNALSNDIRSHSDKMTKWFIEKKANLNVKKIEKCSLKEYARIIEICFGEKNSLAGNLIRKILVK